MCISGSGNDLPADAQNLMCLPLVGIMGIGPASHGTTCDWQMLDQVL